VKKTSQPAAPRARYFSILPLFLMENIMRKFTLILFLVALSQLTGCVAHRYYTDSPGGSSSRYRQQFPAQYPNQYPDQTADRQSWQVQPQETYRSDYQTNDPQSQGNWAQVIDIRRTREVIQSHGGGAVVGAIIGGIIGHQLGRNDGHSSSRRHGHGYGRDYRRGHNSYDGSGAATLGGAIVGGVIGNELDRGATEQRVRTEITLRFSDGQTHTILQNNQHNYRVGDWVRIGQQAGRWIIY
jgi:outer membrane lipoprotein SlyB